MYFIFIFDIVYIVILFLLLFLGGCVGVTSLLYGMLNHSIWFKVILIIGCIAHLFLSCSTRGVIKGILISLFNVVLTCIFYSVFIASLQNSIAADRGGLGFIWATIEFLLSFLLGLLPTGIAMAFYSFIDVQVKEHGGSVIWTIILGAIISLASFSMSMIVLEEPTNVLLLLKY